MMKIPLFKPFVGQEELDLLKEVLNSGWLGLGPKTAEFESQFAKYLDVPHAIALNSCTAALHLAVELLDVKGGEVLVPSITFVSTANAPMYCGARPIFVDVDPNTLCMDPKDLERKVTSRTKAIIPVHMGGHPCEMDSILDIAHAHKIPVIEDVANACGGTYKGRKLGTLGKYGCYSFEAKKNMTTGDGGMITTSDEEAKVTLNQLRWVGINKDTWKRFTGEKTYSWYYEISELGYKYNMNDLTAAIGLAQLKKLDDMNRKRQNLIETYMKELKDVSWMEFPQAQGYESGGFWLLITKVPQRDEFIQYMAEKGITTGVHFMPVHLHPLYRGSEAEVPVSEKVWKEIVTLPLYPSMTSAEQGYVIDAIRGYTPKR